MNLRLLEFRIISTGNTPRPEMKNARISYDGKTWYENGKQVI